MNHRVVRFAGVGCALLIGTAAAATAATPPVPPGPIEPIDGNGSTPAPATAVLSSTKAGTKPVELVVKLRYTMVCGQPGLGTAVLTLPAAANVPARIASSAVLVNGKPAPAVSVAGHNITISLPVVRRGVTCMIVGPGTLTLKLTRAAGLGNPTAAGTYTIRVRRSTHMNTRTFTTSVAISA